MAGNDNRYLFVDFVLEMWSLDAPREIKIFFIAKSRHIFSFPPEKSETKNNTLWSKKVKPNNSYAEKRQQLNDKNDENSLFNHQIHQGITATNWLVTHAKDDFFGIRSEGRSPLTNVLDAQILLQMRVERGWT